MCISKAFWLAFVQSMCNLYTDTIQKETQLSAYKLAKIRKNALMIFLPLLIPYVCAMAVWQMWNLCVMFSWYHLCVYVFCRSRDLLPGPNPSYTSIAFCSLSVHAITTVLLSLLFQISVMVPSPSMPQLYRQFSRTEIHQGSTIWLGTDMYEILLYRSTSKVLASIQLYKDLKIVYIFVCLLVCSFPYTLRNGTLLPSCEIPSSDAGNIINFVKISRCRYIQA